MNITVSSILNIPLVVLLLFLLASCQPDGPAKDSTAAPDLNRGPSTEVLTIDQPFIRRYAGLIDRSPVTLVLVNWGDGRIGGWLKQGQEGKRKSLDGEVSLDESFLLEIFDEMSFEGRLRGTICKGNGVIRIVLKLSPSRFSCSPCKKIDLAGEVSGT